MINKQILQPTFILLAALALVIPMLSCSDKKPRVNRGISTDDTVVEEPSKDVVAANGNPPANPGTGTAVAPKTSANPFEGTWDVNNSGNFFIWTFGYATEKDQKLEGKVTNASSAVVGEYIVLPNETVQLTITGLTNINAIVPYKVSNSGEQIDIGDGPTKVILTKGKSDTTAQNDGNILASRIWTSINNPGKQIEFMSVRKSSSGWNGAVNVISPGGSQSGTFTLTPGKLAITISGSVDNFTYKLRNSGATLDVTDSSGNTETYN